MIWALHGALGSASEWRFLRGEGRRKPLVDRAVDLWQDFPELDFTSWAENFCETVQRQDASPVLLGYSMGGRLALHALLERPALWKAAVIVSAHTGLPLEQRPARAEHDAMWARRFQSESWDDFLDAWTRQPVLAKAAGPRPPVPRHPAMIRGFTCWSLARQEDLLDRLTTIAGPMLWVTGQEDAKFTAIGRRVCERMLGARLIVAPGVGHRVPWLWPAFPRLVLSWLVACHP